MNRDELKARLEKDIDLALANWQMARKNGHKSLADFFDGVLTEAREIYKFFFCEDED